MASTIQIKRGTGSAVPTGLADGELAINLDSGKLYFGSGSTSVNDFSFGEITAEKYIVSSSVLYVTTSFSSGSTEFGNSADDTHTFTGNITASGNIEIGEDASITSKGDITLSIDKDNNDAGGGMFFIKDGNSQLLQLDQYGTLTLSGSFFSSPALVLHNTSNTNTAFPKIDFKRSVEDGAGVTIGEIDFDAADSAGNLTDYAKIIGTTKVTTSGQEGGLIKFQVASHDAELVDGLIVEDGDAEDEIDVTIASGADSLTTIAGNLSITSNITASGNISASGTIDANRIDIQNKRILYTDPNIEFKDTGLEIGGNVTASGDISSSGVIKSNGFESTAAYFAGGNRVIYNLGNTVFLGDTASSQKVSIQASNITLNAPVTASGNISSSAFIYANQIHIDNQKAMHVNNDALLLNEGGLFSNGVAINRSNMTLPITMYGNITASSNISASGHIMTSEEVQTSKFRSHETLGVIELEGDSGAGLKIHTTHGTGNRDVGLNLSSSGDGHEFTIGLNRTNSTLVIAPSNIDTAPSNAVFEIDTTGNITSSGNLQIGNDAEINSVGSMVFRVDSDANEASQTFTFRHNASTDIAQLDEGGNLILYGNQLGQPTIKLQQNTQTVTYGPPVFYFERVDVNIDNADIGRIDFRADDSAGNLTTYAQIIGRTEESQAGIEGGQLELKVASHDSEAVTALKLEDGDAEDEVDVTIANGTDSLTTVAGNLTVNGTSTASTGSFDVMTKMLSMISFAYYVSSTHTSELYIPVAGSLTESNFDQYYHFFHAPYNGTVKRIALSWQSGTPGDTTIRVRKASNFDPDDSGDIVETVVISSAAQDTMYYADFSSSFSKGDVVAFTVQQTGTDNSYVGGTIAMEFDTSS